MTMASNSEESDDLVLVCVDGEVKAHRSIMAARSPAFEAMLESEMKEKRSGRVKVNDFGINIVKAMVQFIYTAKIDEEIEDIVELMKIGDKYLIKSLVDDCGRKLAKAISKENVLDLGAVADSFSAEDLLKSCANFVLKNLEVLGDDLEKLPKDSPIFLKSIVCCLKDGHIGNNLKHVQVSRFAAHVLGDTTNTRDSGSIRDMARLNSLGLPNSGAWLNVPPSPCFILLDISSGC